MYDNLKILFEHKDKFDKLTKTFINDIDYFYNDFIKFKGDFKEFYIAIIENIFQYYDQTFINFASGSMDDKEVSQNLSDFYNQLFFYRYLCTVKFNGIKKVVFIGSNGSGKTTIMKHITDSINPCNYFLLQADRLFLTKEDAEYENMTLEDAKEQSLEHYKMSLCSDSKSDYISRLFYDYLNLFNLTRIKEDSEVDSQNLEKTTDLIMREWNNIANGPILYYENGLRIKNNIYEYSLNDLSNGEKAIFYFLCFVLLNEPKEFYFIDEPENNLNPAISLKLWDCIEKYRPKSTFVYLTHDYDFALSRTNGKIFWIKKYLGNKMWSFKNLGKSGKLPKELMLNLLGARKPFLFCESHDETKYDYRLFSLMFPDYKIICAQGCEHVIDKVKAYLETNNSLIAYGIIDRDYRTQKNIKRNDKRGIYTLPTFEIENFMCIDEFLSLAFEEDTNIVKKIKKAIYNYFLDNSERIATNIVYEKLNHPEFHIKSEDKENVSLLNLKYFEFLNNHMPKDYYDEVMLDFNKINNERNYTKILKYCDIKEKIFEIIKNVANEKYKDFDYIKVLLDRFSTDEGKQVLRDVRIKYFKHIEFYDEKNN